MTNYKLLDFGRVSTKLASPQCEYCTYRRVESGQWKLQIVIHQQHELAATTLMPGRMSVSDSGRRERVASSTVRTGEPSAYWYGAGEGSVASRKTEQAVLRLVLRTVLDAADSQAVQSASS